MKVRKANLEDLSDIQYLSQHMGYDYPIELMEIKLNYILNSKEHRIFVAEDNSKVIGYVHIEIYRLLYADNYLNILGFVVEQNYRKKGVGTKLIQKIADLSEELKCCGIRANSGIARDKAHSFYISNEFVCEKDQKRFIKYMNTK